MVGQTRAYYSLAFPIKVSCESTHLIRRACKPVNENYRGTIIALQRITIAEVIITRLWPSKFPYME